MTECKHFCKINCSMELLVHVNLSEQYVDYFGCSIEVMSTGKIFLFKTEIHYVNFIIQ